MRDEVQRIGDQQSIQYRQVERVGEVGVDGVYVVRLCAQGPAIAVDRV